MHFVMHAFSNHVEVLHNVTPIDGRTYKMPIELLSQSAALFCPYNSIGGSILPLYFLAYVAVLHNLTHLMLEHPR